MSATKCRTCKGTIAARIKKCPHCGESYPDADQLERDASPSLLSLLIPPLHTEEKQQMHKAFVQYQKDKEEEKRRASSKLINSALSKIPTPIKIVGLGLVGIALLSGKKEQKK